MRTEDSADLVAVFDGSRTACLEFALVLEAKAIAYELLAREERWVLLVAPDSAEHARDQLTRYAQERQDGREAASARVSFEGAATGAIGYTLTLLLIAYCAGIGLFDADWFSNGALEKNLHGGLDWWRAVTALTLHLDQLHLFSNLLFGIGAGVIVSSLFGPGIAWASILGAGILANLLEMLISPPGHRAVGASTAVFAALGLLSGFGWRGRSNLRERFMRRWAPLIAGASLLALLGAGTERVDVLGHLLGFITGVALGWIYARAGVNRSRDMRVQLAAAGATVLVIVIAWVEALGHSH